MAAIPSPTHNDNLYICDATTATKVEIKPGETASTWDYLIEESQSKNDQNTPSKSKFIHKGRKTDETSPFSRKAFRKAQRVEKKIKRKRYK